MLNWMSNAKTTVAGIGAILGAVGHLLTGISSGHFDPNSAWLDVVAISTGIGLILAQDAKKGPTT